MIFKLGLFPCRWVYNSRGSVKKESWDIAKMT